MSALDPQAMAYDDPLEDWAGTPDFERPLELEATTGLEFEGSFTQMLEEPSYNGYTAFDDAMCLDTDTCVNWDQILNESQLYPPLPCLVPRSRSVTSDESLSMTSGSSMTMSPPLSDHTLVDSPISPPLNLKFDSMHVHDESSCSFALDQYPFTFGIDWVPRVSQSPVLHSMIISCGGGETALQDYEQPTSQHEQVGAANMDARSQSEAVGDNAADVAFSPTTPTSTEPTPEAKVKPRSSKRVRKKAIVVDVAATDIPAEEAVENVAEKSVKRRKRQDTTPILKCDRCDRMFARRNNLTEHVRSVHDGQRRFMCLEAPDDCTKSFTRKNDLDRHIHSRHKRLGSPRAKRNVPKAKAKAKAKKSAPAAPANEE